MRLPHDNWSYMAKAIASTGLLGPDDVQYLWLPLAHVFGKVLTSGQIELGHVTAVDGRVDKIIENLPVVQPTYMAAVPASSRRSTTAWPPRRGPAAAAKYKIFQWAAEVSREYAKTSQDNFRRTGTPSVPFALRAKHKVADALVYSKLREAFGGRLRAAVSGSAALAPEIGYFFAGAGIHILEGYGLTESSAASFVNPGEAYRTGTVGKPLPGTEVRIADDGEILLRGPGIMQGYHGLAGEDGRGPGVRRVVPHRGHRRAVRRRLSADHRPQEGPDQDVRRQVHRARRGRGPVQGRLSVRLQHPGARRRPELLHRADLPRRARHPRLGQGERPGGQVVRRGGAAPATVALVEGYVKELNEGLQRWQTIKKFRLLPRDLDIEHGELTPSLKLKRPVVEREYQHLIDEMYAGSREA